MPDPLLIHLSQKSAPLQEEDTEDILEYFGEDFISAKKKKNPATYGYGTGYGHGIIQPNYIIPLSF